MLLSRCRFAVLILCASFVSAALANAEPSIELDPETGLFRAEFGSSVIVRPRFVFWSGDWQWLDTSSTTEIVEPGKRHHTRLSSSEAAFVLDSTVTVEGRRATWSFDVEKGKRPKTFGGLSFTFSLAPLRRPDFAPEPILKPDGSGWTLVVSPGLPPLSIRFEPPIARIEFEQGSTEEIRAYILGRDDAERTASVKMIVESATDFRPSPTERLAADTENWRPSDLRWSSFPLDLSFLNDADKPAGKRGFVRAEGDDLVFEDGTPARFWGTNLTGYALFQAASPETVRRQAQRLARMGFNLVRLHHHDSHWVQPNIFARGSGSTRSLNPDTLAKLDWWIKCLRDEGIYVWLDLHVGRRVTRHDDVDMFDEIAKEDPNEARIEGYAYVNASIQARMKEFATAYLDRINPHIGLRVADDPAIVGLLITNENDLSYHFGNALLPDKNVPGHNRLYMALARQFASDRGTDPDLTWQSWRHGPSKLFLNDLEHRFNRDQIGHLRGLGVRAPLATTNHWGGMGAIGLPSLTDGDVVDVHVYGRSEEVRTDPRHGATMAHWIASAALAGKPVTVSEWNLEGFPAFDRAQLPPTMAALGRVQGWRALMHYAYSQDPLTGAGPIGNWNSLNDPAKLATLPAAALLFRRGDVQEASRTIFIAPSREDLLTKTISPTTARAIRTAMEVAKIRIAMPTLPELPWFKPSPVPDGAEVIRALDNDATNGKPPPYCPAPGEVCRDPRSGVFTVDTPRTQLASGWIGGHNIKLDAVDVALTTPNAVVAVQSLDQRRIEQSRSLLVTLVAQVVPTFRNRHPMLLEPVLGTIRIRALPGLSAHEITGNGSRRPIPFEFDEGIYTINLDSGLRSTWLILD